MRDDMEILVRGRHDLRTVGPNSAVVSISDDPADYPELPDGCLAFLRLHFHDIEVTMADVEDFFVHKPGEQPPEAFTAEQAAEVATFVANLPDAVETLACQCEAGISRSAGMAAAIARRLGRDDMRFFKEHLPNRLVYRLTLEALRARSFPLD